MKPLRATLLPFVRYGAFPASLVFCALGCAFSLRHSIDPSTAFSALMLATLSGYLLLEFLFPFRPDWTMTFDTFLQRDAKFLVVNTLTQQAGRLAIGWVALRFSHGQNGLLAHQPLALSLACLFVCFEFLQYWFHRFSHELKGRLGTFLWRLHAAHHLPDRLYVMIHAVGHPLELLATNTLLMLGLPFLLGCSAETTFLFLVFANAIGLISHLNVDLRLGVLNYVFVGPETHRFHHDIEPRIPGNYGAVFTGLDLLFGTLRYEPGTPLRAGVLDSVPDSSHLKAVLAYPFQPNPAQDRPPRR